MELAVTGKFVLDGERNPPPLKPIRLASQGAPTVDLGRFVELRLGDHANVLDGLLDARVVVSSGFTGLGNVEGACAVLCASNSCREWARRAGRPRVVAKIVGILADEPRFVLLTQPRLMNARRGRRESSANRNDAGLVPLVLLEPGDVECPICPGRNVGTVYLSSE